MLYIIVAAVCAFVLGLYTGYKLKQADIEAIQHLEEEEESRINLN